VWTLLSATVRTASATDVCTQLDITGTWTFAIPGHSWKAIFQQQSATRTLTGRLNFSPSDVAAFGYPPGTDFPITKGIMDGNHLFFEETPTNSKTDGTGAHVGVYNGTVTQTNVPFQGRISGDEYDKQVPSSRASFTGVGPALCLSFQPGPPEVAPAAKNWNTPVSVQAKPGSDTALSSPPLGDASKASATANEVTADDLLTAHVLVRISGGLKRVCLVRFARSLQGKVIETDLLGKLDAAYADLSACLALADAIDAYHKAHPAAAQAGASPCAQVQISVTPHGARRRTVHVTHVGPIPNVPVRATCTVGAGRATITVSSNKRGTPLRKLIGPRLQIGLFRSRRDAPGGHVTVRFARR
jgi:hypothetical protein